MITSSSEKNKIKSGRFVYIFHTKRPFYDIVSESGGINVANAFPASRTRRVAFPHPTLDSFRMLFHDFLPFREKWRDRAEVAQGPHKP